MAPNNENLEVFNYLEEHKNRFHDDFFWMENEQPHTKRRLAILQKHPKVKELFGYEPKTKYIVSTIVLIQFALAYLMKDSFNTWYFHATAYIIGGTIHHALFLAMHEISHNLAFQSFTWNKVLAVFANLPAVVPYYASFKVYHNDHHKFLGVDTMDPDLPTFFEARIFNGVIGKTLFCTFLIFFYALRPLFVRFYAPTKLIIINWVAQLAFDAFVIYFWGWGSFLYLIFSSFYAGSLHPCAGHFLSEHLAFVEGEETYSYYGILNYVSFNVGYHNEHHDFPNIPWSRLPLLKKMAPEVYDALPYHTSWMMVIWRFITDPNVSAFNRVKRKPKQKEVKHDGYLKEE